MLSNLLRLGGPPRGGGGPKIVGAPPPRILTVCGPILVCDNPQADRRPERLVVITTAALSLLYHHTAEGATI